MEGEAGGEGHLSRDLRPQLRPAQRRSVDFQVVDLVRQQFIQYVKEQTNEGFDQTFFREEISIKSARLCL